MEKGKTRKVNGLAVILKVLNDAVVVVTKVVLVKDYLVDLGPVVFAVVLDSGNVDDADKPLALITTRVGAEVVEFQVTRLIINPEVLLQ